MTASAILAASPLILTRQDLAALARSITGRRTRALVDRAAVEYIKELQDARRMAHKAKQGRKRAIYRMDGGDAVQGG